MISEYYNNFTDFLDKYLEDDIIKSNEQMGFKMWRTYLWYDDVFDRKRGNHAAFRVPGATRGHIDFDDNMIITNIVFYEDVAFKDIKPYGVHCYKKEVQEAVKEWIGRPVDLNGFTEEDRFKNGEYALDIQL